jgi:hypothetical protein
MLSKGFYINFKQKLIEKYTMNVDIKRRVKEGAERTNIKYTHSGDTARNPLNIDLDINNRRQDSCFGAVWGNICERKEGEQGD